MLILFRWCGALFIAIALGNCGPTDYQATSEADATRPPEGRLLARFSSDPLDSAQVLLSLRADSTFSLQVISPVDLTEHIYSGRLRVTDKQYQLLFADTIDRFNELITPVHSDASVVAYPDHSVVLDKKLRQLYVREALLTADTIAQP